MGEAVDQLLPFNRERFDECMAYLGGRHRWPLTQYDMVKLHVMTDVFHTLRTGRPMIGGPLSRWKHGPVVRPAYNRVRRWGHDWEATGKQPAAFEVVGKRRNAFLFRPTLPVDDTHFGGDERAALGQAWRCVTTKGWSASQRFFHAESFIGRVWEAVGADGEPIDWNAIVDAYAADHPEYALAAHVKALIAL